MSSTKKNILGFAQSADKDLSGILSSYAMRGRLDTKILTGYNGGEGNSQRKSPRSVDYASNSLRLR